MSRCLSKTAFSHLRSSRFSHLRSPPISGGGRIAVRACYGGVISRRPTRHHQQQQQQKQEEVKKSEAPTGMLSSSPADTASNSNGRGRKQVEIKGGEAEFRLRFDMPGMTKEDVKVWVEKEKVLRVKAEKKTPEEEDWPAESYRKYRKKIALPEDVEFQNIKAVVKDGILYITIPKANTTTAKHFHIAVN